LAEQTVLFSGVVLGCCLVVAGCTQTEPQTYAVNITFSAVSAAQKHGSAALIAKIYPLNPTH
jgi:uncharacterized membrane protein (UPF0136 family)